MIRLRKLELDKPVRDPRTYNTSTYFDIEAGPVDAMPEPENARTSRLGLWYDPKTSLLHIRASKKIDGEWKDCPEVFATHASNAKEMVLLNMPKFEEDK